VDTARALYLVVGGVGVAAVVVAFLALAVSNFSMSYAPHSTSVRFFFVS
jgi:uncharacterized membrane protein YwzB